MKVFFLRHGMTARADSDADRSLTADGEAALREVMARRAEELNKVGHVLTGPLGRIRETATIAADAIGYKGDIVDQQSLTKLSSAQEIIASLDEAEKYDCDILLVSHESSLCNLMLWLAGEDILMSNSSLSAVQTTSWQRGSGTLLWQESPNSREIKRTSSFVDQF
jgi:phosphohistidine phosphatase SixA